MDKLIELCAQCAEKLEKGLEITNMRLERKAEEIVIVRCEECGRPCWGSRYRVRRAQHDG